MNIIEEKTKQKKQIEWTYKEEITFFLFPIKIIIYFSLDVIVTLRLVA